MPALRCLARWLASFICSLLRCLARRCRVAGLGLLELLVDWLLVDWSGGLLLELLPELLEELGLTLPELWLLDWAAFPRSRTAILSW